MIARFLAGLCACLLPVASAYAQATHHELGAPELTVLISPSEPWIQEQIVQSVRLESAYPFEALDVRLGEIEGAEVIELMRPTLREFESWGVRGHVYETSRAIIAQRSGPLHLPAVQIDGATLGPDGRITKFTRQGKAVKLAVRTATAGLGSDHWLVARAVSMTEHWSTPPRELRAEQIATRRISVSAIGVSGEHLPELTMASSLGITVAAHEPKRRTEITDTGLIGHLEQDFDIRIVTAQTTDISNVYLPWWHGASGSPRRATVPAYRIEPLPADIDGMVQRLLDAAYEQHRQQRGWALVIAGALFGVLIVLWAITRLPGSVGRRMRAVLNRVTTWVFGPRLDLPDIGYRQDGDVSAGR